MNGVIKENQVSNIKTQKIKIKGAIKVASKRGKINKKTELIKTLICLKI